jgi:hypothetical protein
METVRAEPGEARTANGPMESRVDIIESEISELLFEHDIGKGIQAHILSRSIDRPTRRVPDRCSGHVEPPQGARRT